jgi:hypothetical protein
MPDAPISPLPPDVLEALRAPVAVPDRGRRLDDIMRAVRRRAAPLGRGAAWTSPPSLGRLRRGVLAPATGGLVALGLLLAGGTDTVSAFVASHAGLVAHAHVLGDTVIARGTPHAATGLGATGLGATGRGSPSPTPLRDTVVATLYDTLRIVRLALRAPHAAQVTLAGARDASLPAPRVVTSARTPDGRWELRAVVPRDVAVSSLALVVDGTRTLPVRVLVRSSAPRASSAVTRAADTTL